MLAGQHGQICSRPTGCSVQSRKCLSSTPDPHRPLAGQSHQCLSAGFLTDNVIEEAQGLFGAIVGRSGTPLQQGYYLQDLSLDEVADQLGHTPGSLMTRRYARFLASAQQNITVRSQSVMDEMSGTKPAGMNALALELKGCLVYG